MDKLNLLLIFAIINLLACSRTDVETPSEGADQVSALPAEFHGVWAGRDCELVQTGRLAIIFERLDDKLAASLVGFSGQGEEVTYEVRGVVILDTIARQVAVEARDLLRGGEIIADFDSSGMIQLFSRPCTIERGTGRISLRSDSAALAELRLDDSSLSILTPNGRRHQLQMIEKIELCEPYIMPMAGPDNVAKCLQEWELGTRASEQQNKYVVGIEINTNKHSSVFYFGGMLYCRSARIRSNDNGTVFAQNIRLMWKPGEFTAVMAPDNLAAAGAELVIQDSLFDPNVCIFAEEGIYWSVKSVTDSLIIINGCGEDYYRRPPAPGSRRMVEWIAFREYGS